MNLIIAVVGLALALLRLVLALPRTVWTRH